MGKRFELTEMQRAFGDYIKAGETPRDAVVKAGYAPEYVNKTLHNLRHNEAVQAYIAFDADLTLAGHLAALAGLRDELKAAAKNSETTPPMVLALRGAGDIEIARGKAAGLYDRDKTKGAGQDSLPAIGQSENMSKLIRDETPAPQPINGQDDKPKPIG